MLLCKKLSTFLSEIECRYGPCSNLFLIYSYRGRSERVNLRARAKRTAKSSRMSRLPSTRSQTESVVSVNTEDSAANAKSVVDLVCVNMEESAANAKTVVDLVFVNIKNSATYAKTVVDLVYVNMENSAANVSTVCLSKKL